MNAGLVFFILAAMGGSGGNGNGNGKVGGLSGGKGKGKPQWVPPLPGIERPDGAPMGLACTEYNQAFWPNRQSVLDRFKALGYETPPDRDTMNDLGADASLGGGDDVRSHAVALFQGHYNLVSGKGSMGPDAGGLADDGFVGGCTLNAMEHLLVFFTPDEWLAELAVA